MSKGGHQENHNWAGGWVEHTQPFHLGVPSVAGTHDSDWSKRPFGCQAVSSRIMDAGANMGAELEKLNEAQLLKPT